MLGARDSGDEGVVMVEKGQDGSLVRLNPRLRQAVADRATRSRSVQLPPTPGLPRPRLCFVVRKFPCKHAASRHFWPSRCAAPNV